MDPERYTLAAPSIKAQLEGRSVLDFARALAAEAAVILRAAHGRMTEHTLERKGMRDLVTDVDRRIEDSLADRIRRACPDDAILGEERVRQPGRSGRVWIIDPLDGTTNFVHAHPMVCVSIALAEGYQDLPLPGIVFDAQASGFFSPAALPRVRLGVVAAPVLGETFWGERGCGAFVNDRRLAVSATDDLGDSLLATGFAYRLPELRVTNLENFNRLALRARGIRRGGSAALDLCYVAAGRFDAFWELYLKPWDVAAGMLFVEEAGGHVTDFEGCARAIEGVEVLASNGRMHARVRELLDRADPFWAQSERTKARG
jgi:myo-inositol-1(or 4)-monophosphatase